MISNNNFSVIRVILRFFVCCARNSFGIGICHCNFDEHIGSFYGREGIGASFSSISTFLSNTKRLLHVPGLLLGDFPQFSGSSVQNESEKSDCNSSGSGYKIAIRFNPGTGGIETVYNEGINRKCHTIRGMLLIIWVIQIK